MCDQVEDVTQELPCDARAPGRARRLLHDAACPHHQADQASALLLISELVTNAVAHAGPPVLVSLHCSGCRLRMGVHDGAKQVLDLQPPDQPDLHGLNGDVDGALPQIDENGRGLMLTDTLAARWWIDPTDTGKWVYAELALHDQAA